MGVVADPDPDECDDCRALHAQLVVHILRLHPVSNDPIIGVVHTEVRQILGTQADRISMDGLDFDNSNRVLCKGGSSC